MGGPFLAPLFAAWLWPTDKNWHVLAAAAFLCIPFMLVSMRVERWSAEKQVPREDARRWARRANLLTYTPIVVALVGTAIASYVRARGRP
jgi:hypothetical protein